MVKIEIYEVTLTISNPINFCVNKHDHVLTELNNIYVQKCYLGKFIIEINEIIQISACRIIDTNSSANGIIDVKFSAYVYELKNWDILMGVSIEGKNSLIIGKYIKNNIEIDVFFAPTTLQSNLLNLKQLIPVRVIQTLHKPFSNINAASSILSCDKKFNIYKVEGNLTKSNKLEMVLNNIRTELNIRKQLMKNHMNDILFFESLIYPYKNMDITKIEKIKSNDMIWEGIIKKYDKNNYINIFDIEPDQDFTGYWSRPLEIHRSSPLFASIKEEPVEYILMKKPTKMLLEMAHNMLSFLIASREFIEVYNTPELIKSHDNIWNIMKQYQL